MHEGMNRKISKKDLKWKLQNFSLPFEFFLGFSDFFNSNASICELKQFFIDSVKMWTKRSLSLIEKWCINILSKRSHKQITESIVHLTEFEFMPSFIYLIFLYTYLDIICACVIKQDHIRSCLAFCWIFLIPFQIHFLLFFYSPRFVYLIKCIKLICMF